MPDASDRQCDGCKRSFPVDQVGYCPDSACEATLCVPCRDAHDCLGEEEEDGERV